MRLFCHNYNKMYTLLTSGCSFSECISSHIDTWPRHLARLLPTHKHISKAMGSQGNGLISRSIVYECSRTKHNELLVGIMWSGPDRHDFYNTRVHYERNIDWWMDNPTGFVKGQPPSWVICNVHWQNEQSKNYYKNFHDNTGAYISTLEHLLLAQMYLKTNNIKYFMTTYMDEVLPKFLIKNPHTEHLYKQIDFDNFLPVSSMYEWCDKSSGLPFPKKDISHPSTEQHKAFVDKVVWPHVQNLI